MFLRASKAGNPPVISPTDAVGRFVKGEVEARLWDASTEKWSATKSQFLASVAICDENQCHYRRRYYEFVTQNLLSCHPDLL